MSSPQSNYSDDRGSWFPGEGQPYPDPGWDSRSDKDGAQPSVHYPQQLPYEEPPRSGPEAPDRGDRHYADPGADQMAGTDREWPRGDPELAAVVRRDAGGSTGLTDDGGYRPDAPHRHEAREAHMGAPGGYGAASSIDPPTSQVPTFSAADGPPPPQVPAGPPAGAPGYPAEQGVPPALASMLQPGGTGGHTTQQVQSRRPDQLADGTYRTKRSGSAVLFVLGTLLFAMPPLVLLARSVLDTGSPSGVIAGTLALLGLPLLAAGLHPLLGGGAATGAREPTALLRPPYLYLVVGLVLLVAAGLAAG